MRFMPTVNRARRRRRRTERALAALFLCGGVGLAAGSSSAQEPMPVLDACRGADAPLREVDDCLRDHLIGVEAALADRLETARRWALRWDARHDRNEAAPALEAAQQAWIIYRDAHCAFVAALADIPADVAEKACIVEEVRERARELSALPD